MEMKICLTLCQMRINDGYPAESFNQMFDEIKSFGPKYSDKMNHNLYFDHNTARKIHESLNDIMAKYCKQARHEAKKIKLKMLEAELKEMRIES